MTKTPDELKRGLECCGTGNFGNHNNCPYNITEPKCMNRLLTDALAYIQQLQAENAKKDETIQMLQDGNASLMRMIDEECEKTVKLEAERDAAVADLADHCGSKTLCKKYDDGTCPHEFDCTLYLSTCQDFEWRGVTKEE